MTAMDKASIGQAWDEAIAKVRGNSQQQRPQSAYLGNNLAGNMRGQTGRSSSAAPLATGSAADKLWHEAFAKAQGRYGC